MLPLFRYHAKEIRSYTGVDIEPKNAVFLKERVTDGEPIDPQDYYPFEVSFIHSNVAQMGDHLEGRKFDVIIYTSSIEHMHKEAGQTSLFQAHAVSKPGTILILTCPNTPEDKDGFDTQYRAHVYEWKRSELLEGLKNARFKVIAEWGLLASKTDLKEAYRRRGLGSIWDRLDAVIPTEWLVPVLAPPFPDIAKEIGYIARAL